MMTLEAVAHYVWCGDGTPEDWAEAALCRARVDGSIEAGTVLGQWMGGHLPVVLFTFRYSLTMDTIPWDEAKALAVNLAEHIVGEADVQVLGLKYVPVNTSDSSRKTEGL